MNSIHGDKLPTPERYGEVSPEKRKFWEQERPSCIAENERIGTIPIKSGRLLISDPCYEKFLGERIWCTIEIDVVPHDDYEVRVAKSKKGCNWNDYLWVGVYHPDYADAIPNEVAHDDIGVDSATLSFSDTKHKFAFATASTNESGHIIITKWDGVNVVMFAIYDGGYPVLVARNDNDKIIAVEVHLYETDGD